MFFFSPGHVLYRSLGLLLFLTQFSLFLCGMPPFHKGIWIQTEPTVFMIFLYAVATCVWLAYGVARKRLIAQPLHPLWLCMVLWIMWQFVATTFSVFPWQSWFGPAETGEGLGWHLSMVLMVMLGYPLWQVPSFRRMICLAAVINLFLQCALHWKYPQNDAGDYDPASWSPGRWGAYLAFMAGNVWIALAGVGQVTRRLSYVALVIFTIVVLVTSLNKTAIIVFPLAMLVSMRMHFKIRNKARRSYFYPTAMWRKLALAGCFVPMLWVGASVYLGTWHIEVPKESPWVHLINRNYSLGSRLGLNQVVVAAMKNEPERWMMGSGWGNFPDVIAKYALIPWSYVYKDGVHKPSWFMIEGSAFHSHDQPLEALLSLGLIGMALWYLLPMAALWIMPRRHFWQCAPMILSLVALSYFWFELPQCVAYHALGLVALCSLCPVYKPITECGRRSWTCMRGGSAVLLLCLALVMAWSAREQWQAMDYGQKLHDALSGESYKDFSQEWLESDIHRGGYRLWTSAVGFIMYITDNSSGKTVLTENDLGWYAMYLKALEHAAAMPQIGARVAYGAVWTQYKLLVDVDSPLFSDLRRSTPPHMTDTLLQFCRKAPLRDDLTAAYLGNLSDFPGMDTTTEIKILNEMLAIAPNNRGALWTLGRLLTAMPGHEREGMDMMRRAVALGLGTIFPLTDKQLEPYQPAKQL